jgi:hypothetical protein
MIFFFLQVGFQESEDEFGDFFDFVITQTGDQGLQKIIIGKFLQVNHQRFLVGFPVQTKTDQPLILIDKMMGMVSRIHDIIPFLLGLNGIDPNIA